MDEHEDTYLDALSDLHDEGAPPVEPEVARAVIRAGLSEVQAQVLDDVSRFLAILTPRGAGKTADMLADVLTRMTRTERGRFVYGALTKDSGVENVWDELKRQDAKAGTGLRFDETRFMAWHPETAAGFRIRSLETKREVDKFRGKQYHAVYLDELQSVAEHVLVYALTSVLPPTLRRHRGVIRVAGTPLPVCAGLWYSISSRLGQLQQRFANGAIRAISRPYAEREDPKWRGVAWTWSLHKWGYAGNPVLKDAETETREMRDALAITPAQSAAMGAEYGDWPEESTDGIEFRFSQTRDTWIPDEKTPENPFGLFGAHDWMYVLSADLALRRDKFALVLWATSRTSQVAFHVDEFHEERLSIAEMAKHINRFRRTLGKKLAAIVGDSQGPTGHEIFIALQTEHKIPIEKAKKSDKDDHIELFSSDLVDGRIKILRGSELARQLATIRKGPDGKRAPNQVDDVADAAIYGRRRMLHMLAEPPKAPPSHEEERREFERQQLRRMSKNAHVTEEAFGGIPVTRFRTEDDDL